MKLVKTALFIVATSFLITTTYSQSSKVYGIEVEIGTFQGLNSFGDSTFAYKGKIYLLDSLDILNVHLKLGSSYKGDDLYNDSYHFHPDTNQTNPSNISRNGLILELDLGAVVPDFFYWEITTENLNNVLYLPYRKQK